MAQTGEIVRNDEATDALYDRLEQNAIEALNDMFETDKMTKGQAMKAKLAQGALASVQSHQKTKMTRRSLDFAMARALTSDPAKLAEYVKLTQPDSGIVKALPTGMQPEPIVQKLPARQLEATKA